MELAVWQVPCLGLGQRGTGSRRGFNARQPAVTGVDRERPGLSASTIWHGSAGLAVLDHHHVGLVLTGMGLYCSEMDVVALICTASFGWLQNANDQCGKASHPRGLCVAECATLTVGKD